MGRSARQVGFVSQEAWQRITHDRCTCRNDASFSRERIDILKKIGVTWGVDGARGIRDGSHWNVCCLTYATNCILIQQGYRSARYGG